MYVCASTNTLHHTATHCNCLCICISPPALQAAHLPRLEHVKWPIPTHLLSHHLPPHSHRLSASIWKRPSIPMCTYMFVYMCTRTQVYCCVCISAHKHKHAPVEIMVASIIMCGRICVYTCGLRFICHSHRLSASIWKRPSIPMCIYMFVYMCTRRQVYCCVCISAHKHKHAPIEIMVASIIMCGRICVYTCGLRFICIRARTHAHMNTHMHACIHVTLTHA